MLEVGHSETVTEEAPVVGKVRHWVWLGHQLRALLLNSGHDGMKRPQTSTTRHSLQPCLRALDARARCATGISPSGVGSVRPRQNGQVPGSAASTRRIASAGMSWTAMVLASTELSGSPAPFLAGAGCRPSTGVPPFLPRVTAGRSPHPSCLVRRERRICRGMFRNS